MKYLKKFATSIQYNEFKNSTDYITPNVSLVIENNPYQLFYQSYITPESNPLDGGAILMLPEFGDTTELGKLVYQYLRKKCFENDDLTYTLAENESLSCQYYIPGPNIIHTDIITITKWATVKLPAGGQVEELQLISRQDKYYSYYVLEENGILNIS